MFHPIDPARALATFDDLDIEVPGLDRLAKISAAISAASAVSPAEDLAAAIIDGTLEPDDAADRFLDTARAQTAKEAAEAIHRQVVAALSKATARAVRDHGDAIISELQPRFATAADDLAATTGVALPTRARHTLADPTLTDTHTRRATATAELTAIARVRSSLAETYRFGPREESPTWWITGKDLTQDDLDRAAHLGRKWLALIEAGFRLHLATPSEAEATATAAASRTRSRQTQEQKHKGHEDNRRDRLDLEIRTREMEAARQ